MHEGFQFPTAIIRVQYHLLGGRRRLLAIACICLAALVAGTMALRQLLWHAKPAVLAGWILNGLAAVQIVVVALGGCHAVYRAMLRDHDAKMLESHRLTPMSNLTVVIGYLFGSTIQILVVLAVIALFGCALTFLGGYPVADWVYGNALLLNSAVTLWSIVLLAGLHASKPINPAPLILGVVVLGNVGVVAVPAAGVLLCAYSVIVAFQVLTGASTVSPGAVAVLAGINLVMTVFWISVAAVKYRRPDLPALNAFRGFLLLAFWVVVGTAGIVLYDSRVVRGLPVRHDDELVKSQWISTMLLSLVVAVPAVAGAVECRVLGRRGAALRDWTDRVPALVAALAATVLTCGTMGVLGNSVWRDLVAGRDSAQLWVPTVLACLSAMLTVRAVFLLVYSLSKKPRIVGAVILLAIWCVPPVIDLIRAAVTEDVHAGLQFSSLLGFSPAGTMVATWTDVRAPLWPGLLAQAVIVLALTIVAWHVATRRSAGAGGPLSVQSPPGRSDDDVRETRVEGLSSSC